MVTMKGLSPNDAACVYRAMDFHNREKTENLLKEIKENQNWTLEGRSSNEISHEAKAVASAALGAGLGVLAGVIPWTFGGSYGIYFPAIMSFQAIIQHVNESENKQIILSHKLNKMANWHKQDGHSEDRKNLAKRLETIVETAAQYTMSRNIPEIAAGCTIGATLIAVWADRFQIPVFATGVALTSFSAWKHRANMQNELDKVRQNVDVCLGILEKEKTSTKRTI